MDEERELVQLAYRKLNLKCINRIHLGSGYITNPVFDIPNFWSIPYEMYNQDEGVVIELRIFTDKRYIDAAYRLNKEEQDNAFSKIDTCIASAGWPE